VKALAWSWRYEIGGVLSGLVGMLIAFHEGASFAEAWTIYLLLCVIAKGDKILDRMDKDAWTIKQAVELDVNCGPSVTWARKHAGVGPTGTVGWRRTVRVEVR
jgi:hypothetical protein